MNITKKQTEEILSNFLAKENGLNEVLSMTLNAMMYCERNEYLSGSTRNKGNGFRLGKVFGHGSQLELRIPRDRQSDFTPTILALFRDQEHYLKEVSFKMYSKGLTTRDISDVMETIYGIHYSKSKVSNISQSFYERMEIWRDRDLASHYLALYIDGLHVKLKRNGSYRNECFYIILGLKEDFTREVISIVNFPSESAQGWQQIFLDLKNRGLQSIGIIVSDGLTGLDNAIAQVYRNTPHQKCIVHLQRNLQSYVARENKKELAQYIRDVLSPDDPTYTQQQAHQSLIDLAEKWKTRNKSLAKHILKIE